MSTIPTRWLTLPREARDTLLLLAVIAWVIGQQAGHLPWWCSLMAAGALAWRAVLAWKIRTLPSRWWLATFLTLAAIGTWHSHQTLLGRDAGVTFLVVLLALKTLELRARRDAFVVFFLGFFVTLTHFFYSQSLLTAGGMVVSLWGLLTALVNSHMPVGRPPLTLAARHAAGMMLAGAPIMVCLFVLFPRIGPLWSLPSDALQGRSGLSGHMRVGTIASLALDESVAMRVQFSGPPPAQSALYFRGPVFTTFDGREWKARPPAGPAPGMSAATLEVSGSPVAYEVTLAPTQPPWALALDATPASPQSAGYRFERGPDLTWRVLSAPGSPVRYQALAYPQFKLGPTRFTTALLDDVALPPGFNPRTLQWAADLRRQPALAQADAPTLVNAVLETLRQGGYEYTLEPGVYGTHTADEFWFDRKAGFCEHIASSFVVVMRALDIPARIVTGYQGGQAQASDATWVIRQSDAHAWAEVWLEGQGWVRVDPTAAVAPARTGTFQPLLRPPGVLSRALETVSPGISLRFRGWWDAANSSWDRWVTRYTKSEQLDLLRHIGFRQPDWQDLSNLLIACVVASCMGAALWVGWERRRKDPWLQLLEQARRRLGAPGLDLSHAQTPRAIASLLRQHGSASPPIVDWLTRLETWRYGPAPQQPQGLRALRKELRTLLRVPR